MLPPTDTIHRVCKECGHAFIIDVDEQAYFRDLAERTGERWSLPARCLDCRRQRRSAALAVPASVQEAWYDQVCVECGAEFRIGPRDVATLKARGWAWPKRCRICRAARQQMREQNGSVSGTTTETQHG